MDYRIIWSDSAIADLHDICAYIARDNPTAALRLGKGILAHVRIPPEDAVYDNPR